MKSQSLFDIALLTVTSLLIAAPAAVAQQAICTLAALAAPGGCLVLDAFVPQPVTSFVDFRLDYRRAHESGFLERRKRITAHADGTNRIERRYRLHDADGREIGAIDTDETVRPYAPDVLAAIAAAAGWQRERTAWDYGAGSGPDGAKFASLVLR